MAVAENLGMDGTLPKSSLWERARHPPDKGFLGRPRLCRGIVLRSVQVCWRKKLRNCGLQPLILPTLESQQSTQKINRIYLHPAGKPWALLASFSGS